MEPERVILRIALKLLLTTSILSLVPKVTSLSPSLSALLSQSLPNSTPLSLAAPKLLTRQIKASTYHLQKILLRAHFSNWATSYDLGGEARLAVALIVSFTLELTRDAGRQFAKYANSISETVSVGRQHVEDYERNVERGVFDRLRSGVFDFPRGGDKMMGELGDRLRDFGAYSFCFLPASAEPDSCPFETTRFADILLSFHEERKGERRRKVPIRVCDPNFGIVRMRLDYDLRFPYFMYVTDFMSILREG